MGFPSCHFEDETRRFWVCVEGLLLGQSPADIFSWWHSENQPIKKERPAKERLVRVISRKAGGWSGGGSPALWPSPREPGVSPEDPQRGETLLLRPVPLHLRPEGRAAPPHALPHRRRWRLPVQLLRQVTEGPAQPQVPREAAHRRASPLLLRLRQRSAREGHRFLNPACRNLGGGGLTSFGCVRGTQTNKWKLFSCLFLLGQNKKANAHVYCTLVLWMRCNKGQKSCCRNVQLWAGRYSRALAAWGPVLVTALK